MFLSTASTAVASTASIALKTNCTIHECAVRWLQLHTLQKLVKLQDDVLMLLWIKAVLA